jgi:hypothetical protein
MLAHDAEMNAIAGGQARVIFKDPAGLQERALRDREDRQAQLSRVTASKSWKATAGTSRAR